VLQARFKGAAGPNVILKDYLIGFEVTGQIKRSDFGLTRYAQTIGDDVDLIISAPFARTGDWRRAALTRQNFCRPPQSISKANRDLNS